MHFPEENIADGRPGRTDSNALCARSGDVDPSRSASGAAVAGRF